MTEPRKRPGFWWLLFYGRRRRGFPLLLVATFAAIIALALASANPRVADLARGYAGVFFLVLLAAVVVLAVLAVVRPRRRR